MTHFLNYLSASKVRLSTCNSKLQLATKCNPKAGFHVEFKHPTRISDLHL